MKEDIPHSPHTPKRSFSSTAIIYLVLGAILVAALSMRLYGINWDSGHLFHPDERAILMKVWSLSFPLPPDLALLLNSETSPINPKWFPYGSFPLYLLKLSGHLASAIRLEFSGPELRLVGRALSAIFDAGAIALVFVLGSRIYGRATGLLAAAFLAFSALHIQSSHFFTTDPILAFLVVASVLAGVQVARTGGRTASALMGVAVGLGLATKISIAPVLTTVAVAHTLYYLRGPEPAAGDSRPKGVRAGEAVRGFFITLAVAAAAFVIAEPYAFLDKTRFLADVQEQSEMVRRIRDYPYTRQYVDTAPYLYHITQLTKWGLGLPLGIVAWLGFLFVSLRGLRQRRTADLLILSWAVPYFLITGAFQVKFMRYMLPLTPFLALMGAEMLMAWQRRSVRNLVWDLGLPSFRIRPFIPAAIAGLVLLVSALYSVAYLSIYTGPHPAVQMSRWINTNVPTGAVIAKEHWEEGIPELGRHKIVELDLYEPDNQAKVQHIIDATSKADYIVSFSNRLYGTIPRLPDRYPVTSEYYQKLFSGELGYELATVASSYPSLLGLAIKDDTFSRPGLPEPNPLPEDGATPAAISLGFADESFTVYDHPKAMLFKKRSSYSPEMVRAALAPSLAAAQSKAGGPVFSDEEFSKRRFQGNWWQLFPKEGFTNRFPLLSWLFIIEALALLVLPVVMLLFAHLPDRGYMLAKVAGVLAISYTPWLLSSLKVLPFTRETFLLTGLALALLSAIAIIRRAGQLKAMVRQNLRVFAIEEALFLASFLFLYQVRLLNPDLWHPWRGGEKPMDFAYLNAVIRSEYMPPYDPWFAGGYLNYYYFGQVIVGSLIKLSGIIPSVAYNLAVPLLFALTAGGCFSLAYNLASLALQGRTGAGRRLSPALAGVSAAVFVTALGNLDGALQLSSALQSAGGLRLPSTIPGVSGFVADVTGLWNVLSNGGSMPAFDYWRSSRMMPPTISITEFPYFTFLFADLHAHLISIPFTVASISLAVAIASSPSRSVLFKNAATLLAAGWLLGAVRWINSWDYPTYLLITLGTIAVSGYLVERRLNLTFAIATAFKSALVLGASIFLYLPLQQTYQLFYSGVQSTPETTPVPQYLLIHGLFLFIIVTFIAVQFWESARTTDAAHTISLFGRRWWRMPRAAGLYRLLVKRRSPVYAQKAVLLSLAFLGITGLLWVSISPTAALLSVLGAVSILAMSLAARRPDSSQMPQIFALGLVLMAALIGIGVDTVAIKGDINRMNTVFKFYLQAWVLYGIAAAYALWWLLNNWLQRDERPGPVTSHWRRGWALAVVILIAIAAIYPLAGTPARVRDRFAPLPPSNDGMAFMQQVTYNDEKGRMELKWDHEAFSWIQENLSGTPVVMEGVTPLYRWGSRVSVYTGLPTVIGWDWHQKQQRWGYQAMVDQRIADVNRAFNAPDPAQAMSVISKYGVEYVYLGQVERLYYSKEGIEKFREMAHRGQLKLVYENPGVELFQVTG